MRQSALTQSEPAVKVLGIETSCDETGVAIYDRDAGLLGHRLFSQVPVHADYGGVVPELAARDHVRKLSPLLRALLADSGLEFRHLDAIAYTAGPGLIGALLVGASTARALAFSLGIPAIEVHHMEAHLLAPLLEPDPPGFPFVALLVSGGHTMLVEVTDFGRYLVLGQTLDDAAGEAFDKSAKMLGLPYPGGPALARLAEQGDPAAYRFPRPMTDRPGMEFSFSGLKTFVLNTWNSSDQTDATRANIAASFQDAVAETLAIKCRRALEATGFPTLVVSGGVGANRHLRAVLKRMGAGIGVQVRYPRPEFCTDNGAMIAYAGLVRLAGAEHDPGEIRAYPRWPLDDLPLLPASGR